MPERRMSAMHSATRSPDGHEVTSPLQASSPPQNQSKPPAADTSTFPYNQAVNFARPSHRRESDPPFSTSPTFTQLRKPGSISTSLPGRTQPLSEDAESYASEHFPASLGNRDPSKWVDHSQSVSDDAESRIRDLERKVRRLAGERSSDPDGSDSRGFVEKVPPIQPKHGVVAPKIRGMPWYEWLQTKSSWDQDTPYVIDVLAEDSILATEAIRNKLKSSPPDEATRAEMLNKLKKTKTRPERIRINSWYLQRWLEIVSGNDRLAPLDRPFVLLRPFKILRYHEAALRDEHERLQKRWGSTEIDDETSIDDHESTDCQQSYLDLDCLINFMDEYINPMPWTNDQDIPSMIPYSKLWYLLNPGTLVYSRDRKVPQRVWKVISRTGGRKYLSRPDTLGEGRTWQDKYSPFVVHCYRLDHDGNEFVRVERKFSIEHFDGVQPLTSLSLFPLNAAEKDGLINLQDIIGRGELFVECLSRQFRHYSGQSHWCGPDGEKLKNPDENVTGVEYVISEAIDSHVMVDFQRTLQMVPAWRPVAYELEPYTTDIAEMKEDVTEEQECIEIDTVWDARLREDFIESESAKLTDWARPGHHPQGEDLLLLPDRVFGFIFRTRKWACLQLRTGHDSVGDLNEIAPKSEGWDDLKLVGDLKVIIQSLMCAHFEKSEATEIQFDLVKNKGKSMVILLHGPPGVGKTSTAECIAEYYRKPLLPITCGDLGTSAQDVENRLQANFQLATAWNCVLLLDEADIFLAQRNTSDVKRNALVSVFLRVLEYYEGILFLTTNRIGAFDEAFKSRCHMALHYPPLVLEQTKAIWESHIDRAQKKLGDNLEIDKEEILHYAEDLWIKQSNDKRLGAVWNGRQIRNAFQSALALSRYEIRDDKKLSLKIKYLRRVADASSDFSEYLFNAHGHRTDADRARTSHIRYDRVNPNSETTMHQHGPSSSFGMSAQNMASSPTVSSPQNYGAPPMYGQMQNFQPQAQTQVQSYPPSYQSYNPYVQSPPANQQNFNPGHQSSLGHNFSQAPHNDGHNLSQQTSHKMTGDTVPISMTPGSQSQQNQPGMAGTGFQQQMQPKYPQ